MKTRKLSNKGQVILSTAIFSANQQKTGLEFATTTLDKVVGCTGYVGKSHSIADMHEAITTEIKSKIK